MSIAQKKIEWPAWRIQTSTGGLTEVPSSGFKETRYDGTMISFGHHVHASNFTYRPATYQAFEPWNFNFSQGNPTSPEALTPLQNLAKIKTWRKSNPGLYREITVTSESAVPVAVAREHICSPFIWDSQMTMVP